MSSLLPVIVVFLVFLGGAWWIGKTQMRSYGKHVADVKAINDEIVAINREMIAELREIKEILRDQK